MHKKRAKEQDHTSPEGYEVAGSERVKVLKDQLARALADYDNFRKRTEAHEEGLKFVIMARVVRRLLPVFDMLYEAQIHLNDSGLALTIKELEDTLKAEGVEKIEPKVGEEFNEELHEANEVVNSKNLKDGQVAECVLKGWKFREGNVIRHAKVIVNKVNNHPEPVEG